MKETNINYVKYAGVIVLLVAVLIWVANVTTQKLGEAPGGSMAVTATSSTITMTASNDESTLFATSTCIGRIITAGTKNIRLKFADSALTLSSTVGHLQIASTTVVYDSAEVGCGLVTGLSTDVDTVTVTELQGFR